MAIGVMKGHIVLNDGKEVLLDCDGVLVERSSNQGDVEMCLWIEQTGQEKKVPDNVPMNLEFKKDGGLVYICDTIFKYEIRQAKDITIGGQFRDLTHKYPVEIEFVLYDRRTSDRKEMTRPGASQTPGIEIPGYENEVR